MAEAETIDMEVAYATPEEQAIVPVKLAAGATVGEAIEASGILRRFPEIELAATKVGIFGRVVTLDQVLRARDRVEIYRPLIADPKEVRRKRAAEGKDMKKGGA